MNITNIENLSEMVYLVEFEEGTAFQIYLKERGRVKPFSFFSFPPSPDFEGTPKEHVHDLMESQGMINWLYEPDELATCQSCGKTYLEAHVNMVDYDDDVCYICESEGDV